MKAAEGITGKAADWEPDTAAEAPESTGAAGETKEIEVVHFAGQAMTSERATLLAFEASNEGMGT